MANVRITKSQARAYKETFDHLLTECHKRAIRANTVAVINLSGFLAGLPYAADDDTAEPSENGDGTGGDEPDKQAEDEVVAKGRKRR